MKRFCVPLTFAFAFAVGPFSFSYAQTADRPELLNKVLVASKKLRYSGIRKVHMKFGPDVVQHTEYILKDGTKTRIWFPEGGSFRGQIIVENDTERRHYFPDRNQIEVMPPRREEYFMRLGRMGGGRFEVKYLVEPGEAIAGVDTKRVSMVGKENQPFLRMWIDPATGLVLKRVVYGRDGNPQATSEFVKVDFRPSFKRSDFELSVRGAKVVTPRDRLQEMVQRGGFQNVSFSPKDPYKLESVRIQRIENVSALVQVYVKSDGRVSLYQVKAAVDPNRLKPRGRDRASTYSWTRGETSFILVGDLPQTKLREIAARLGG
jgi:outer membrane lipoprotein-sorting protein